MTPLDRDVPSYVAYPRLACEFDVAAIDEMASSAHTARCRYEGNITLEMNSDYSSYGGSFPVASKSGRLKEESSYTDPWI